jgi:hypothetical protein
MEELLLPPAAAVEAARAELEDLGLAIQAVMEVMVFKDRLMRLLMAALGLGVHHQQDILQVAVAHQELLLSVLVVMVGVRQVK